MVPGGLMLEVDVSSESGLDIPKAFCISFIFTHIFLNLPKPNTLEDENLLKFDCCAVKLLNFW